MDRCTQIVSWKIVPHDFEYVYTTDANYQSKKRWLESKGYTMKFCKNINANCRMYGYGKVNEVRSKLIGESGNVYENVDLHDVISRYYKVQKLFRSRIKSFVNDVNTGKISLIYDDYSNTYFAK